MITAVKKAILRIVERLGYTIPKKSEATQNALLAEEYPRLKAERDFYSSQMAELQTQNMVLTKAATQYALQVQELEGQLSKQSTELVAKIEQLSKQSALDRPLAFMAVPKTSGSALSVGLCEVLPSTARIHGYDH